MSLKPPNNRLVGKLSRTPENESLGKASLWTKHLGKKHILGCHIPVPKHNGAHRVLLSVIFLVSSQKKPTAFSTAKSNTPQKKVALTHITFSLTKEAHSCKSFH